MALHAPADAGAGAGLGCGHGFVHSFSEAKRVSGCHEDCHPERPHRIAAMYQYLDDIGLAARCVAVAGTEVTREQVVRVHSLPHWEAVQATRQRALDEGGGGAGRQRHLLQSGVGAVCAAGDRDGAGCVPAGDARGGGEWVRHRAAAWTPRRA
jgi:hypothetical protein